MKSVRLARNFFALPQGRVQSFHGLPCLFFFLTFPFCSYTIEIYKGGFALPKGKKIFEAPRSLGKQARGRRGQRNLVFPTEENGRFFHVFGDSRSLFRRALERLRRTAGHAEGTGAGQGHEGHAAGCTDHERVCGSDCGQGRGQGAVEGFGRRRRKVCEGRRLRHSGTGALSHRLASVRVRCLAGAGSARTDGGDLEQRAR